MIGYVTLGTNDIERAARFYDELLKEIGAKRFLETEIKGGEMKAEVLDRYISNIDHPDEAAPVESRAEQGKGSEEVDMNVRDVEDMKEFLGTFEGSQDTDEESVD